MSAVSDRARDFWDRISPRERALVALGGVAAPIILLLWIGMSISDGLEERELKVDKLRKALVAIRGLKERPPAPVDDIVTGMPAEPVSLDTYLTSAAQGAGFVLKGTTPRNPVTRNGFVTNSVSLTINDLTLDQLKKFLMEVEKSKYVAVTRLDLTRREYKGKDKLDAALEVSTYAKDQAKKADGAGSDAAGDKKGG